jgi:molecular chaperone HscB
LIDPFDLFQLEPAFSLDLGDLGKRHRDLSKALHPDRYAGRPSSERRAALGRSIEVNEAFRVLKDPVRRAEALLERLGEPMGEGTEPPADPEFLMEMMERREALRDLGKKREREKIEALVAEVGTERERVLTGLDQSFARAIAEGAEAPRGRARLALGKLRYLRRFFDEAEAVLDELG